MPRPGANRRESKLVVLSNQVWVAKTVATYKTMNIVARNCCARARSLFQDSRIRGGSQKHVTATTTAMTTTASPRTVVGQLSGSRKRPNESAISLGRAG